MAKGFPDYFGQSIWPKYGTMLTDDELVAGVAPGATATILYVTGQGQLRNASLFINGMGNPASIYILITVDGVLVYANPLYTIMYYFGDTPSDVIAQCTLYDIVAGIYSIVINREIPFVSSFKVEILNNSILALTDFAEIYYYHVV